MNLLAQNYRLLRAILFSSVILAGLIQCFVDDGPTNLACVALAVGCALVTSMAIFRRGVADFYPLSSLQVLMFSAITQVVPLWGTLLDGHPLVYNLDYPVVVFGWVAGTQIALLLAHYTYRILTPLNAVRSRVANGLRHLGFYTPPTIGQLWLMGLVGLVPFVVVAFLDRTEQEGHQGPLVRFLTGFSFFAYAPFLIPVYHLFFPKVRKASTFQILLVLTYFGLTVISALLMNSRAGIAAAVSTVIFCCLLAVVSGRFLIAKTTLTTWVSLIIIGALMLGPLSRLSNAMVVARKYRGTVSYGEMMQKSIEAMFDDRWIQQDLDFAKFDGKRIGWDETYLSNPFLTRFADIKYHDLGFGCIAAYRDTQTRMLSNFTIERILAIAPDPVVQLFDLPANKKFITRLSMGDILWYLKTGTLLVSFRTGSFIAHGVALFGWAYPLVLAVVAIFLFLWTDSLGARFRFSRMVPNALGGLQRVEFWEPATFSTAALIMITPLVTMFYQESMALFIEFLVRTYFQMIIFYFFVFRATKFMTYLVNVVPPPKRILPVGRSLPR